MLRVSQMLSTQQQRTTLENMWMPANRTSSTCHFADSTTTKRGSTQLCSTPHFTSNENNPDTYPRLSTTHHHLITIYTAVRTASYFLQCYSTGTCMMTSQTSIHIHAHSVHILFQGGLRDIGIKTKQLLVHSHTVTSVINTHIQSHTVTDVINTHSLIR